MMDVVVADLEWVMAYWPDLIDARLPMSTPRPWRQPELSPQARTKRDALARIEQAERNPLAIGESPAPVDVSILSTAFDVLITADDLAAVVAEHAGLPVLPPPRLGELDAWPYLAYAAAHMSEDLADYAAPITARMVDQVARAVCMVYDGQVLDVLCPWCDGRTTETPAGGAKTWRVMLLPGDLVAIVCAGLCEPSAGDVGTWWHGQPCWPIARWDWLAKRLRHNEHSGKIAS